jgi:hypothetical protein
VLSCFQNRPESARQVPLDRWTSMAVSSQQLSMSYGSSMRNCLNSPQACTFFWRLMTHTDAKYDLRLCVILNQRLLKSRNNLSATPLLVVASYRPSVATNPAAKWEQQRHIFLLHAFWSMEKVSRALCNGRAALSCWLPLGSGFGEEAQFPLAAVVRSGLWPWRS